MSRILTTDGETRNQYPLWDGLFAYFPAALLEVARWSLKGNEQHNPGEPLHWAREKSTDHENKILRHLLDAREVDGDGFVEAVALAWRALALCQTILEERGWAEGANAKRNHSGDNASVEGEPETYISSATVRGDPVPLPAGVTLCDATLQYKKGWRPATYDRITLRD